MGSQSPKRRYDSSRRRAQAEATRRDIINAAGRLFSEHGYVTTTIDRIADEAGVSPDTVYGAFGSKRSLLKRWVETCIAGDASELPMMDRTWVTSVREAHTTRDAVRISAETAREILERSARAIAVLGVAGDSDPEIATLHDDLMEQRYHDMVSLVEILATRSDLRVDPDDAAGTIWALSSPEIYSLLVEQRGWSPPRFQRWLDEVLAERLLDDWEPSSAPERRKV